MSSGRGAAAPPRRSELATRAVTGVAMIVVAVAALWAGGAGFWMLASAAALLMVSEWAGLMRARRWQVTLSVALMGIVMAVARVLIPDPSFTGSDTPNVLLLMYGAVAVGAVSLSLLSLNPKIGAGLLYAGLPAVSLIYLRDGPAGFALTLWTLAVVWGTDIGAYFAGRTFGGPKLAPRLSPKKTWSGLIGGALAAVAVGAAITHYAGLSPLLLWLGAPMAVLAQMGDLYESWLKRRAGVKDSGRLLPGHGGALDRLDGLVPVAVAVALLMMMGQL
jgi:phosphatidate cytidylyltransferase